MNYTQKYIDSVDGMAHQSAVETIKDLESKLTAKDEEIERLRAANKDALAWYEDLKVEFDKLRRERDEYVSVLAYYGNSCDIYQDARVRLYAIETLEKYTGSVKTGEPK